jgi:hypothetical protein
MAADEMGDTICLAEGDELKAYMMRVHHCATIPPATFARPDFDLYVGTAK